MQEWLIAIILGTVEGLTEFLPISSTGHLILVGKFLNFTGEQSKTFEIVIQLGSIMAVVFIFWSIFAELIKNGVKGKGIFPQKGVKEFTISHLAAGCIPAFVLGLLLHGFIKKYLFMDYTVLIGLVAGGILMIVAEQFFGKKQGKAKINNLNEISIKQAFFIGTMQCLAIWPGFSRSGSTISGGLIAGLSYKVAAEFSFLLAVPVMIGASALDLIKSYKIITPDFLVTLGIGFFVAFLVAIITIKMFLKLLNKLNLTSFAIYRFVIALLYALIVL